MEDKMDAEDRKELNQLRTTAALTDGKVDVLAREIGDIKRMLESLKTPRPTNWVGICSFGLALTLAVGSFVGMFLNMRMTPMEMRLRTMEDEFKQQTARVQRELEWNFQNQSDRYQFTDKTMERLWDRVFTGDPPQFTPRPKP